MTVTITPSVLRHWAIGLVAALFIRESERLGVECYLTQIQPGDYKATHRYMSGLYNGLRGAAVKEKNTNGPNARSRDLFALSELVGAVYKTELGMPALIGAYRAIEDVDYQQARRAFDEYALLNEAKYGPTDASELEPKTAQLALAIDPFN